MTGKATGVRIKTPSDGYRALTVDICLGAALAGEVDFFETDFGKICLDYLGINLEAVGKLKQVNGNGHDR